MNKSTPPLITICAGEKHLIVKPNSGFENLKF